MGRGLLLVVSGPSGAGKGTVCRELRRRVPSLKYSISATTRPPRPGEQQGVDYYFVSEEEFLRFRAENRLLEWARIHDHYYGTPRQPVVEALTRGEDILLEIDVQGAKQVKEGLPEAVTVFLLPPSYQELCRRLRTRGTEDAEQIGRRLQVARGEMEEAVHYDYLVVNDYVNLAADRIEAIILAEKCRPRRAMPDWLLEGKGNEQTDH
ncbi:MAG: guanylate kinase [Clostridia bacterium]|jgi:guanylate kinase|nr:guanylate kinase [Clostridia bacterium]MDH7572141.1 guanylate kinase [Clostridia bacterium]